MKNEIFISKEASKIPCVECGGEVIEFSIPNDIWNKVIRPNGEHDREYLCMGCFLNALRIALGLEDVSIEQLLTSMPKGSYIRMSEQVSFWQVVFPKSNLFRDRTTERNDSKDGSMESLKEALLEAYKSYEKRTGYDRLGDVLGL
jgi:hypothetical protein